MSSGIVTPRNHCEALSPAIASAVEPPVARGSDGHIARSEFWMQAHACWGLQVCRCYWEPRRFYREMALQPLNRNCGACPVFWAPPSPQNHAELLRKNASIEDYKLAGPPGHMLPLPLNIFMRPLTLRTCTSSCSLCIPCADLRMLFRTVGFFTGLRSQEVRASLSRCSACRRQWPGSR